MANVVVQGEMVLDTVATVTANQYLVTGFRWVSASAAAGSECKITDTAGKVWFDSFATGADWEDSQNINTGGIPMAGVKVATLSDGVCYVYFK